MRNNCQTRYTFRMGTAGLVVRTVMDTWVKLGACRGTDENFFSGRPTTKMQDLCENCPVAKECYEHALKYEVFGFWAGTTEKQREKLRKEFGIPIPAKLPENIEEMNGHFGSAIQHGTNRGYNQHRRQGVPTCEACRKAHNVVNKTQKRENKDIRVA